jgi:uncharacterized protein with PIN domain
MSDNEHALINSISPPPKFLTDRMVGRLAKWLRILGCDTAYLPQLSPQGLMREARRQGRIILTRDTRLLRDKQAPPFLFIREDHFRQQLKQVVEAYCLDPLRMLFTRCAECNEILKMVKKEEIQEIIPPYVWQTQDEFRQCPGCRRIYWGATHKEHVMEELRRMGLRERS